MWPTNNRWSFHLSLGGWSLSHTLFTLYNICMTKKVWQIIFNVKATMFYTCKTDFPNSRPLRCRLQSLLSVFVKPVRAVVILVTVRGLCQCLHVRLYTCPCIHNLLQSISYINTTECSSYTQRGRERSLNASSWSNGTTLDYNCQEWQLEKRTKTWPNSQTNYFTVSTQKMHMFLFQRYKIKRYE